MSAAGAAERLRVTVQRKRFPAIGDAPAKLVIENLTLEELARDARRELAFVGVPLKLRGATGSPLRPLALV